MSDFKQVVPSFEVTTSSLEYLFCALSFMPEYTKPYSFNTWFPNRWSYEWDKINRNYQEKRCLELLDRKRSRQPNQCIFLCQAHSCHSGCFRKAVMPFAGSVSFLHTQLLCLFRSFLPFFHSAPKNSHAASLFCSPAGSFRLGPLSFLCLQG